MLVLRLLLKKEYRMRKFGMNSVIVIGFIPGSPYSLSIVILNAKREGSSDRTYCLCHPGHCSGVAILARHSEAASLKSCGTTRT